MAFRYPVAAIACLCALSPALAQREASVSLDGEWEFRFAPDDRGASERWFAPDVTYEREITVPGCWDAQGVGEPTDKMWHNAIGVGWYRRDFEPPALWQGRRVWLVVGGVHRSAQVWVNGQAVGEHVGYPVAFRLDITAALRRNGPQRVVIAVDSRRDASRDPLIGAFDIIDYMDLTWGGIYERVWLEATGDCRLQDAFAVPDPERRAATLQADIAGETSAAGLRVGYSVRCCGEADALASGEVAVGGDGVSVPVSLPTAPLWTPARPNLLVAELILRRGAEVLDQTAVRFGLRRVECTEEGFLLNGERFFFRGYGDDYTFPLELAAPAGVDYWREYLQRRKQFGFNGVRHHSTMMSEAYLTAADEVGMLVQPELPIGYQPFYDNASPEARKLYGTVWAAYIKQMRNHPSVFAWCMGNELYDGLPIGPELYATAKRLDPTRPVIDTDGLPAGRKRDTLDYHPVQFNEWSIPWGAGRDKYGVKQTPRPCLVHEMGNLSVLPDPAGVPLYSGAIRPFWLQQMAAAVQRLGLQDRLPEMLRVSRKLQASLIKLNIEAARLGPSIDGYHQWLFRDYWTQSTGFVDQFDRTREITPEKALQFNGEAALLWDHDRVSYRCGEDISLPIYLSDFRPREAPTLSEVTVSLGGTSLVLQPSKGIGGRGLLGPWTGSIQAPYLRAPQKLQLRAQAGEIGNCWDVWVFPPAEGQSPGVLVTSLLSERTLKALRDGAAVLLTSDAGVFPALTASFKTAWWKGDEQRDHVYGNMFSAHPALRGFPSDGYGDLQAYALLHSRPVVMLDEVPGNLEPIIWCLDVPWRMAEKAYLFEAKVGHGRLLVSTMNLSAKARQEDPAAECMFQSLLAYAGSDEFRPTGRLPLSYLRRQVAQFALPDSATWVEGFGELVDSTEGAAPWQSYREDDVDTHPVRQTDGKQRVAWQTAALPEEWPHKTVTFVWAGGIGWRSQPEGGPLVLWVNGKPRLSFPFTTQSTRWSSPDDSTRLDYLVRRATNEDTFGLFFLTLPADQVGPGRSCEIALTAPAADSRRWVSLVPYTDVVRAELVPLQ